MALWTTAVSFVLLTSLAQCSYRMLRPFPQGLNMDYLRSHNGKRMNNKDFDWYSLTPAADIIWVDCFTQQKCARLSVPLDYSSPEGPKADIALQMKPATDKTNYKGTVLVNPGGPGGPGTQLVHVMGDYLASLIGPEFDILGFDPRGIGATTPLALCFQSELEFVLWSLQDVNTLNASDGSIPFARARDAAVGERCLSALGGTGSEDIGRTAHEWGPGRFMDTATVATDMLRITEKLGQEKLQYSGLGYGTVLGQYFASMYPDKVGRMLLDGVLDGLDYRAALWSNNLYDADAVFASFYSFCHRAGPYKCPVYETTIDKIEARINRVVHELTPFSVPFTSQGPVVVTKEIMVRLLFLSTYVPVSLFPIVAYLVVAIENNNQPFIAELINTISSPFQCEEPSPWLRITQAQLAIICSDGDPVLDTPAEYEIYFQNLLQQSTLFAPIWARIRLQCTGWKIRPKSRYLGPLSSNTSFPILFVSSTFDPVCPLLGAQAVQKRYPGSRLLIQNSYGHTAMLVPSNCTAHAVHEYFASGVLPQTGTVCQPDVLPFMTSVDD